jgi:hypothetical protein
LARAHSRIGIGLNLSFLKQSCTSKVDAPENRGCRGWQPHLFLGHQNDPRPPPMGYTFVNETDTTT